MFEDFKDKVRQRENKQEGSSSLPPEVIAKLRSDAWTPRPSS